MTQQLGFDTFLQSAEEENRKHRVARETAHLPGTMAAAAPLYRAMIGRHHAAMLAADIQETMRLREEARRLALKLNDGRPGILAGPDAPGNVLARQTAAMPGDVPLWGQEGAFLIDLDGMPVRIALAGIFGIGACAGFWLGFSAHAVEPDRPFLSSTGYRSFLGIHAEPVPGMTPDHFVAEIIRVHVARELKGRLLAIEPRYRDRLREGAS